MNVWTANERILLKLARRQIGECIALGSTASQDSRLLVCEPGFDYRFGQGVLTGNWSGGDARITFRRLDKWIAGLPPKVREGAVVLYKTWPIDTSDPEGLDALVIAVVDADDPEPPLF